ncbi:hypothetical protein ABIA32_002751 [Streptacidiphilus sp. MAP12-20]|uniref:hypothetical protein n=1 Tax=Streptacidiphilus sp. MAP12-20 TaxID=3156299 RepID=UPI0035199026
MSAITATPQATGLAVELHLDAALPQFLDLLASAFDDDPETVAGLLVDLAQVRRELAQAQEDAERRDIADCVTESLGAQVDRLHQDLTEQLSEHVTVELNHREVCDLSAQLMGAARRTLVGRLGRAS